MPLILIFLLVASPAKASIFGEENIPLMKLVLGQIQEIKMLTDQLGVAQDQAKYLMDLNEGIENVIHQIESIQAIIERAKDLDPTSIRSVSDLNDLLRRAKETKSRIEDLMILRSKFAGIAIEQSALQSDTTYKMGQEMIQVGSTLAEESRTASPGRATQISAASGSAQMLAQGVQLQTMAHLVQLQAMSLELQRTQLERDAQSSRQRRAYFESQLSERRSLK